MWVVGGILSEFYSQFYLVFHKVQFNRKFEVTTIHFKNYSLYVLKKKYQNLNKKYKQHRKRERIIKLFLLYQTAI